MITEEIRTKNSLLSLKVSNILFGALHLALKKSNITLIPPSKILLIILEKLFRKLKESQTSSLMKLDSVVTSLAAEEMRLKL